MPVATSTGTAGAVAGVSLAKVPGDWSADAYRTVATELTSTLDLGASGGEVINALVFVHFSIYTAAERLRRRQGRILQLGPSSFLELIHHYVVLSNEKREALEEEQRHLNVGLDKLKETVDAVSELQKSLAVKRQQLEAKDAEANEKLQRMVVDQKQAEEQKTASIEIQRNLEVQEKEIGQRREVVMGDLADAEPAVQEAQASVSNIKKQHLTEVRSMGNPPAPVKNTMESVCILLGHRVDNWKAVQALIRRDDFISSIVHFDTDRMMTRAIREKAKRDYLSKPGYDFETINRASKACGPLAKWVIAQVRFSEILDRVGPLRDEVDSLERQAEETKQQAATLVTMISELEASIGRYKSEYAALISETQAIRSEMERVQTRVDRSIHLLGSLGSEKERWDSASRTFEIQRSTILGDALLSAAFLTYAGIFDQIYRTGLWQRWTAYLSRAQIQFKPELSFVDYLSTADDRLDWQSKSLPADVLATENAIMLKRFHRYPLIIDPSGQATNFLMQDFQQQRKLTVTSFLDPNWSKALESALRFGNALLLLEAEHFDPLILPILNRELRRTGGRVLIRLGSQDIDFSPSFTLFLSTRDPSAEFSPDVCSRVTFVNFTMTRSSLQSQTLDQVLKVERPDTDKKRADLMKLQGEFRLRLRHLEKSLLAALNDSKGNILDDDNVIDTLETLKREAADVTAKVEETDAIMQEVDEVTTQYAPLSKACSSLFFILDQLNLVSHFYQFSLRFFFDIFDFVLRHNPHLQDVSDPNERLAILTRDLFVLVYRRTSCALAHQDHILLAVLLSQIWARDNLGSKVLDSDEFMFLLEGGEAAVPQSVSPSHENEKQEDNSDISVASTSFLDADQRRRLNAFKKLSIFYLLERNLSAHPDTWRSFLRSNNPENEVPRFWKEDDEDDEDQLTTIVRCLLVVKCMRPDRMVSAMSILVSAVFGTDLLSETAYDLGVIVSDEVRSDTPIALCSVPGFDASFRVDYLVQSKNVKCISVAMGSQEGFTLADQAIATGTRTGQWVLLKNVHLSPSWLSQLEKKLHSGQAHRNFRLFLTCETNPVIPVNFLRQSRILMNEPPPGLKANMLDNLQALPAARLQKAPAELMRLCFLLAFFHATLTERLRYTPLGWTKAFEFNDADASTALDILEAWITKVAKGRTNVDPASIPWDALRSLLEESVYGGKIDNDADQRLLDSFVDALFTPQAYEHAFALVDDAETPLQAPEGIRLEHFLDWVRELPDTQPPQWLALPPTAERVIAIAQGVTLLNKLVRMRQLADDDESSTSDKLAGTTTEKDPSESNVNGPSDSRNDRIDAQPSWMKSLRQNVDEWLKALPESLPDLHSDTNSVSDPLFRFWAREHRTGSSLLREVRADLQEVAAACSGAVKQTNRVRALLSDLPKGTIPASWRQYAVPKSMSLPLWIADFAQRLAQLASITSSGAATALSTNANEMPPSVTLGLLFSPGAYLTATRQAVAHRTRVSLENLHLELLLDDNGKAEGGFSLQNLKLEGASWIDGRLTLNDGSVTNLSPSSLIWLSPESAKQRKETTPPSVPVCIYLNADRTTSLFYVNLPVSQGTSAKTTAQRAVALRAA